MVVLFSLSNEYKRKFYDSSCIKNRLFLIENPWHLEITSKTRLAALILCNHFKLFDEFIELKNDNNLEVIFKEKREQKEYTKFWNLVLENTKQYKNVPTCCKLNHVPINIFTYIFILKVEISKECVQKSTY